MGVKGSAIGRLINFASQSTLTTRKGLRTFPREVILRAETEFTALREENARLRKALNLILAWEGNMIDAVPGESNPREIAAAALKEGE